MNYSYPDTGRDMGSIASQIEASLPLPDGYFKDENGLNIMYKTSLSDKQKASLDTIMVQPAVSALAFAQTVIISSPDVPSIGRKLLSASLSPNSFSIFSLGGSQWSVRFVNSLAKDEPTKICSLFGTFLSLL